MKIWISPMTDWLKKELIYSLINIILSPVSLFNGWEAVALYLAEIEHASVWSCDCRSDEMDCNSTDIFESYFAKMTFASLLWCHNILYMCCYGQLAQFISPLYSIHQWKGTTSGQTLFRWWAILSTSQSVTRTPQCVCCECISSTVEVD